MSNAALKVKIFASSGTQVMLIPKTTLTIGSSDHCDVIVEDATVAGEHVRAWLEGGRVWIQDLGAPGGTTLNGIRLPALKPMLVRELDILKVGEYESTMGFEPNVVRAPTVRTHQEKEETPSPIKNPGPIKVRTISAASGSSAEVSYAPATEEMAREMADLRLQLQMAQMENEGRSSELIQEVETLRQHKSQTEETLRHLEQEKRAFRKQLEDELAELRLKAIRDLKQQHDADVAQFESFKRESVLEVLKALETYLSKREKSWSAKPMNEESFESLRYAIRGNIKKVFLNQEITRPQKSKPRPSADATATVTVSEFAKEKSISKKIARKISPVFKMSPKFAVAAVGLTAALSLAVWKGFSMNSEKEREPASLDAAKNAAIEGKNEADAKESKVRAAKKPARSN